MKIRRFHIFALFGLFVVTLAIYFLMPYRSGGRRDQQIVRTKANDFFGHAADSWLKHRHFRLEPTPPQSDKRSLVTKLKAYSQRLSIASSYAEVEDQYYQRLQGIHVLCAKVWRIGPSGDGGWDVCLSPAYQLQRSCLVYSFGVNNVWSFDEFLAADFGCTVRAFDPSMNDTDHVHWPGPVNFYRLGLAGSNQKLPNGWSVYTFNSILKMHGEENKTIDLVKVDIEYSEWESFEAMFKNHDFKNIKQLLFEVHTNDRRLITTSKADYFHYHEILDRIEERGFRRFHHHDNPLGKGKVQESRAQSMKPEIRRSAHLDRTCCHELGYINMNFAHDTTGLHKPK